MKKFEFTNESEIIDSSTLTYTKKCNSFSLDSFVGTFTDVTNCKVLIVYCLCCIYSNSIENLMFKDVILKSVRDVYFPMSYSNSWGRK